MKFNMICIKFDQKIKNLKTVFFRSHFPALLNTSIPQIPDFSTSGPLVLPGSEDAIIFDDNAGGLA